MAGFQDAADLSNWRPDSASLRDLLKPAEAPKPHIQQLTAALNDLASALDADGDALTEFSVDTESMQRRATMPSALSARSFGESHSSGATHVPITAAAPVLQPSSAVLPHNLEPNSSSPAASATNTQHAFLSYQWDVQDQVIKAKEHLTRLNLKCWMDIDGGMKSDIYDSMAEGVQGAACVVCFMTPAYQDSANCKLELKFAQQSGVPIIPVMMQANFTPSGWLGILTAGAIWVPLHSDADFQEGIGKLLSQLLMAAPHLAGSTLAKKKARSVHTTASAAGTALTSSMSNSGSESVVGSNIRRATSSFADDQRSDATSDYDVGAWGNEMFSFTEMRDELERLRMAAHPGLETESQIGDDSQGTLLCPLPALVPKAAPGIMVTPQMKQVLEFIVSPSTSQQIGFCGMG